MAVGFRGPDFQRRGRVGVEVDCFVQVRFSALREERRWWGCVCEGFREGWWGVGVLGHLGW